MVLMNRQPALKAFANLKGAITLTGGTVSVATGGAVLAGRTSIVGTKEWAECSNRGHCDDGEWGCLIEEERLQVLILGV